MLNGKEDCWFIFYVFLVGKVECEGEIILWLCDSDYILLVSVIFSVICDYDVWQLVIGGLQGL